MKSKRSGSWVYRNSLSIVFLALFIATLSGQALTGWNTYNDERTEDKGAPVSFNRYLQSGHFISATFENFESEFLQMALYVTLTVALRQIGSSESKKINGAMEVDRRPDARRPGAPWPVKKGGMWLRLYNHSLFIVFGLFFIISFLMHLHGSLLNHNEEARLHAERTLSTTEYLGKSEFWFEAFQNWQSEFLSIAAIVIFSIFLRQKGSPESKPVDAPTWENE